MGKEKMGKGVFWKFQINLHCYESFMRNTRNAKGKLEAVDPSRRMPGSLHDRGAGRGMISNPF